MRIPAVISALLLAAAVAVPAAADQPQPTAPRWAFEACVADHAACVEKCRAAGDDGKGGAGCLIACATAEVECVAGRAAKGVTPWIERKTDQFRDFLDEFLRDLPIPPEDKPAPPPRMPRRGGDYDRT